MDHKNYFDRLREELRYRFRLGHFIQQIYQGMKEGIRYD